MVVALPGLSERLLVLDVGAVQGVMVLADAEIWGLVAVLMSAIRSAEVIKLR